MKKITRAFIQDLRKKKTDEIKKVFKGKADKELLEVHKLFKKDIEKLRKLKTVHRQKWDEEIKAREAYEKSASEIKEKMLKKNIGPSDGWNYTSMDLAEASWRQGNRFGTEPFFPFKEEQKDALEKMEAALFDFKIKNEIGEEFREAVEEFLKTDFTK
jgi:hypothetical protein